MKDYVRRVHYHETDKMGVTHHSNYIRWMEEARIDFLDQLGYNYARLEREGIISPVIGIDCQYKKPTVFDDMIGVHVTVEEFRGVKLVIGYTMTDLASGEVVLTGRSTHCFVDAEGKPIILRRSFPDFDAALRGQIPPKEEE